jgi:hypothetical protein
MSSSLKTQSLRSSAMKKLLILCIALSSANAFAWGCDESQAGQRLIERVERIRNECAEGISKKLEREEIAGIGQVEGEIMMCEMDAQIQIQKSFLPRGEGPTLGEADEASNIIDNYESDIKRQLGL